MTAEHQNLEKAKQEAKLARDEYLAGLITYKQAEERIAPYKQAYNDFSKELAKKYNQKPQRFRLGDFLRYRF
ncbi:hypothetical protein ACIFOE_25720 [Paenibacillus sp. NRS-1783]|uniref:hypothetical protein n=1 Tax=Paenibacillus sp. NRS-1783 TaxID=3233907 RepID=UPI003D269F4B